jgi:hypothetical protein
MEELRRDECDGILAGAIRGPGEISAAHRGVDLFRLAIQGWAYAQSCPQTKAMIQGSIERQLASYRKAAKRWVPRAKVDTVARALAAAVIGYVVQSAFADTEIDPATYCEGLALLD